MILTIYQGILPGCPDNRNTTLSYCVSVGNMIPLPAEGKMVAVDKRGTDQVGIEQNRPRQHCQAIIEGVRCIRRSPVAEFQIVVGNAAIGINLCESCKNTLGDEHPDWKFTRVSDFQ